MEDCEFIGIRGEALDGIGGGDGRGEDEAGGIAGAQGMKGRVGGRAGGDAVIDEDDAFILDDGRRTRAAVMAGAAGEVLLLEGGLRLEVGEGDAEGLDDPLLEVRRAGFGDGSDGELGVVRGADLVGEAEIERGLQGADDFRGYGHTAARQGEDEEIAAATQMGEGGGEPPASIRAIAKDHDARIPAKCAARQARRPMTAMVIGEDTRVAGERAMNLRA